MVLGYAMAMLRSETGCGLTPLPSFPLWMQLPAVPLPAPAPVSPAPLAPQNVGAGDFQRLMQVCCAVLV